NREPGGFGAFENLVDVCGSTPEDVGGIRRIGHKSSGFDRLPESVYRWQPSFCGEIDDLSCVSVGEGVWQHAEPGGASLSDRGEGSLKLVGTLNLQRLKLHCQHLCRSPHFFEENGWSSLMEENAHARDLRNGFLEQLQIFANHFRTDKERQSRD